MWQKLQCLRHTILVVFQQIPNNLICQNDSPHVIYALDAVSVYFAYIYMDKVKRCVHLKWQKYVFSTMYFIENQHFQRIVKK